MSRTDGTPLRILGISGSLRQHSLNSLALRALMNVASTDIEVTIFNEVGLLPLFNPDLECNPSPALTTLKQQILFADALVLASPEYAHGISGVMKNLLDHLVSGHEFVDKPVALINTSPRASHAQQALREVVSTMSGRIIESACIDISLLGHSMNLEKIMEQRSVMAKLHLLTIALQKQLSWR